ncbi:MAG: type II toxin-antitoxin system VapC family toxin [Proteobacteria bacterium]|nr:type II toxin-antitoxin system VapC family toxin [Pseudomonadota bacterium]
MTKYLLDTCTYIWIITDNKKLSNTAKEIFENKENQIYISIISQIEISVKHLKHKIPQLSKPIIEYFDGFRIKSEIDLLNLECKDVQQLFSLPKIHSDPFDRLLISQALNNQMTLISPDKKFLKYPVRLVF